jgi:hypothetical protein
MKLNFPFWIVIRRRGVAAQPVEPEGMPGCIAAFTPAEGAASFMADCDETNWESLLVGRATLPSLLAELRRFDVRSVCFDPGPDARGAQLALIDLESFQ